MAKGEVGRFWQLLRPHALPKVPALGVIAALGAVSASMQTAVMALLWPLWNLVLFPSERGDPALEANTVGRKVEAWFEALAERARGLGWFEDERTSILVVVVVVALVMAVVAAGAQFGFTWTSRRLGYVMIMDLRMRLARHLMGLSIRYHGQRRFGDLLSRVSTDVATALHAVHVALKTLVQAPLLAIGCLLIAYGAAPGPALAVAVVLPLVILPVSLLSRRVRKGSQRSLGSLGSSVQALTQMFSGIRTVKSFGGEERELETYRQLNQDFVKSSMKMVRAISFSHAWTTFYATAGVAVLILVLGWLTIEFGLFRGGAEMSVFLVAIGQLNNHMKVFTRALTTVQESAGAAERLQGVLDEERDIVERDDARPIDGLGSGVRFEDLSFVYPLGERPAVHGLDLELRPGETLALVGPSGSGKSTVMDLVARFLDPSEGRVAVDGVDLRDVRLADWTSLYALVGQQPFLFHASIRENIAYGRAGATQAEIETAAGAANIHEFIASLPDGYETDVADMGSRLSGGQRQRITIARAILKGAPLLLLDEATSALDSESEIEVQRALDALMEDRTVLVIAHRLSTIRGADRIAVLEEGVLVELGTHDELVNAGGTYARLYSLQQLGTLPEPAGSRKA